MTEAAKTHARTLLKLVNSQDTSNGIIPLDFSNKTHYDCVSAMFGGEDFFQSVFPGYYHAAKTASRSPRPDALTSNRQGFLDIAKIQYIAYNPGTDKIHSSCYSNQTGRTSAIYQIMYLYKDGNLIGVKSDCFHNKEFARMNMDITSPSDGGGYGGEVTAIVQTSWKNAQGTMMSTVGFERRDERSLFLNNPISDITIHDPIHWKTAPSGDICISYGRNGSDFDYSYPEARLEKMQKVFLNITGTVTLKEGSVFVRGEPNSTSIVLNHTEMGTIWYLNDIKDKWYQKYSNTFFEWRFYMDWKNVIPSSIQSGTRSYAFDMMLDFWAIAPGETAATKHTIYVSSYDQEPKPDNYVKISNLKLHWFLLEKNQLVTMSDGTTKPIAQIQTGDMHNEPSASKHEEAALRSEAEAWRSLFV